MKKILFAAATLFAAGFVSCTDSDNEFKGVSEKEKAPILFSVGSGNVSVTTRGTGAVGDTLNTDDNKNFWRGEKLNVYMFKKDVETLEIATDAYGDIFNNTVVETPSSTDATATGYASYGAAKYYPMAGNFDFFAYHADDAAQGEPAPNADGTQYILPVVLDGTQDLMISKADMSEAQREEFLNHDATGERYYSAFSARRKIGYDGLPNEDGIQPHFKFKHLLSRLVFFVKPSTELVSANNVVDGEYYGVTIDSIKIVDAYTNASFVVAWKGEVESHLTDLAAVDTIALMQKVEGETEATNLEKLTPMQPLWDAELGEGLTTRVGESMLLIPQSQYKLQIFMSQVPGEGAAKYITIHEQLLTVNNEAGFEAGKQYNVKFTVYGLEEIKLELELAPWEYGEDIPVDNDKN